jgi:hypothetical protein
MEENEKHKKGSKKIKGSAERPTKAKKEFRKR